MLHEKSTPENRTPVLPPAPRVGIAPKRGECLQWGDVVCLASGEQYRILHIQHDSRTVYSEAVVLIVDERASRLTLDHRIGVLTIVQPRFYSTLIAQEKAS